jgi:hypothetical protein
MDFFKNIKNIVDEFNCKRGKGWLRPWNRELNISGFRDFNIDNINYLEQIRDGVIDTMLLFVGYRDRKKVVQIIDGSSKKFRIYKHSRIDEKKRKFQGVTISFASEIAKNRFDRVDLILEDMERENTFDDEVNSARLYISPLEDYLSNDYELLYWDSSDKRSLEVFQTAFDDLKLFYKK